jgi:hypothetical protein
MIPDAPISSFSMKLNGGKKGILVITDGNDDICSAGKRLRKSSRRLGGNSHPPAEPAHRRLSAGPRAH